MQWQGIPLSRIKFSPADPATNGGGNNPAANNGNDDGGDNDDDGGDDDDPPSPPTFDEAQQTHLNKLVGDARKEARKNALDTFARKQGYKDAATMEAELKESKKNKGKGDKTAEGLQAQIESMTTEHGETLKNARTLIVKSELRARAAKANLNPDALVEVVESLGGLDRFEVDFETGEIEGLDQAITSVKKLLPKGNPTNGDNPDPNPDDKKGGDPKKKGTKFFGQSPTKQKGNGNNGGGVSGAAQIILGEYRPPAK